MKREELMKKPKGCVERISEREDELADPENRFPILFISQEAGGKKFERCRAGILVLHPSK